ncbi:MAG: glycosyltransferase family 1 protein [Acidobacteria bacterium]|nr:MAG: glycosyltransferase family 1 protein [Acidobacteriota bacterium]
MNSPTAANFHPGRRPASRSIGVSLFACDRGLSGIGRYMINMMSHMLAAGAEHHWHVWVAEEDVAVFPFLNGTLPDNLTLHRVANRWNRPALSLLWHAVNLPLAARRAGVDALYLPAGNRRLVPFTPIPTVAVVHDLSSFHVEGKYDPARMLYIKRFLPWMIRQCARVITISSSSAHDITKFTSYPQEDLTIIGLGYDEAVFRPRDAHACRAALEEHFAGFPDRYLFYVSRIEHPGKNHLGLLRAFRQIISDDPGFRHHLVFAGGDWNGAEVVRRSVAELGLGDYVHMLGFVPDELLPSLYGGADALIFPSLFEGFGLPIVEAQAVGIPVAAAGVSSIPEVAGDAALLFDPHDTVEMASAVRRVATDYAVRDQLRIRGFENATRFTWQESARRSLAILEELGVGT